MTITSIIAIIVMAIVILAAINLANRAKSTCVDKAYIRNEWVDILNMSKDPKTRPMSIIRADKLLNEALKGCGYQGNSVGERLISAKNGLKHRNEIWNAHKLRNKIVHQSLFEPTEKEVNTALNGYHQTFKDLGVI
jgi:hypothetical protein